MFSLKDKPEKSNETITSTPSIFVKNVADILPATAIEKKNETAKIVVNETQTKLASVVVPTTKVAVSQISEAVVPQNPIDTILDKNNDEIINNDNEESKDVFDEEKSSVNPKNEEEYNEDDDDGIPEEKMNEQVKQAQDGVQIVEHDSPSDETPTRKVIDKDVQFQEDPDSNFFAYLCGIMFLCIFLYVLQQNRHKILALCLEGRRGSRRGRERSRGGSKAAYSKLDCNLEEAIMSKKSLNGKSMDIIY